MNTVIINQFFGAGDIIFCQGIAAEFVRQGKKVIWPVQDIYAPLAKHFPDVTMVDKKLINIDYTRNDEYEINGTRVIPLRFSDSLCCVPYTDCMKSKYILMGMDWQKWKDSCYIKRDWVNERKLFWNVLGLKRGDKYNLISDQFTTGGVRSLPIPEVGNGLRDIRMQFIEGFTLIDWLSVIQNATTIHAVASSNIYLFELYHLAAQSVTLYVRRPNEQNHDNYSYLLKKDYILHP